MLLKDCREPRHIIYFVKVIFFAVYINEITRTKPSYSYSSMICLSAIVKNFSKDTDFNKNSLEKNEKLIHHCA
ncbi:hypothetical protein [Capnocytophaga catalasegens]|uniref:hypothetical protein n=1 Tax=Capnocytophaga catalasegens TaxID=1004260 RepID=UPI0022327E31|nr:hypothetical protein [Capnocytophaga catalasegens]